MSKALFLLPILLLSGCGTQPITPTVTKPEKDYVTIQSFDGLTDKERLEVIHIPLKDETEGTFRGYHMCFDNCDKYLTIEEALQMIIDHEGLKYVEGKTEVTQPSLTK